MKIGKVILSGIAALVVVVLMVVVGQGGLIKADPKLLQSEDTKALQEDNRSSCDVAMANAIESRRLRVQSEIEKMSLEEKLGQLMMVSIPGTTLDEETKGYLRKNKIGGVVLFKHNMEKEEAVQQLTQDLKENSLTYTEIPMFIGTDEEGGSVSRIPQTMAKTPSALEIGKSGDSAKAYEAGQQIAKNLKALGINLDFAPVCDILTQPENTVIGNRSFSSNPQVVTQMASEFYRGIQEGGVMGAAKHFPGHGDTIADSHMELPSVETSVSLLKERELLPFKKLTDRHIDMLMVGHIMVRSIDEEYPVTLSEKIKKQLIMEYLGYEGIIITDDMKMKAISDNFTMEESVRLALDSGCHMILSTYNAMEIEKILAYLTISVEINRLEIEKIDQALMKIMMKKFE